MKITIICAGKIKEKYFVAAIAEYTKRLSRYASLEIKEVQDEKTPENASEAYEEKIKRIEGERMIAILQKIKGKDSHIISLEIEGRQYDSFGLSDTLSDLMSVGKSHFIFMIGGSLGLSKEVSALSDLKLSFSKLTFPHQLMRLLLLEQIYRSFRILNHEPYHK